jgi:hypothetical protein
LQALHGIKCFSERTFADFFELFEYEYHAILKDKTKVLRSYLNILLVQLERICNPQQTAKTHNSKGEKVKEFEKLVEQHFRVQQNALILCRKAACDGKLPQ